MKKKKLGIIALTLALTTVFVSCTSPATVTPETGSDQGSVEENYSEIEAESDEDGGSEGTGSFGDGEYEGKRAEAVQTIFNSFMQYVAEVTDDPERQAETEAVEMTIPLEDGETTMEVYTIKMDGREMKFTVDIVGEPGENGYPLYITLHGGGGGAEEMNNGQWLAMTEYYKYSVENGIYVAVRGMEDVWNLHFLDDSYPMYDRLIEDMIMFSNADPNRVYLLGFSAGGDGVYAIAPRMADRFAAVNMSSGHPNGVSLLNASNLPFEIQVGIRDYYADDVCRSIRGAEFEKTLNDYKDKYGCEYPHRVLVHVPEGHNYNDNYDASLIDDDSIDPNDLVSYVLVHPEEFAQRAVSENWVEELLGILDDCTGDPNFYDLSYQSPDGFDQAVYDYVTEDKGMLVTQDEDTNAVHYVNQFTRNPIPTKFVWDLSTRANKRKDTAFYWLRADFDVDKGVIEASYDEASNTITIKELEEANGNVSILVNPRLMDINRTLNIVTPEGEYTVDADIDAEIVDASVRETGDPFLSWVDEIVVTLH